MEAGPRAHAAHMSREAWVLFAAMSVIWGMPYLFIKIAVEQLSPSALVLARTALGAVVLLPLAVRSAALRPALAQWRLVLAFAVLEMAVPWLLLTHAEERIASGLAGLLIATVPLVGAVVTRLLGDRAALSRIRVVGIVTGLAGVAALVGIDSAAGHLDLLSVAELFVVAVGYATAPILVDRRLQDVPTLGVIALSLALVALIYLPFGVPALVSTGAWTSRTSLSVLVLGLVCTALAFVLFFRLIAAAGPVRATVITFLNPAVAVLLGLVVLDEPLTVGVMVGFPLVLAGSWLATRPTRPVPAQAG